MVDGAFDGFGAAGRVELDEPRAFVQNIPDNLGDAVGDSPDCLYVSEADNEALKDRLEVAVFGSDGGLRRLAQQSPQETISFGRAAGMVLTRTLVGTGTNTNSGSHLRGGGNAAACGPISARISWAASAPFSMYLASCILDCSVFRPSRARSSSITR